MHSRLYAHPAFNLPACKAIARQPFYRMRRRAYNVAMDITLPELEQVINYWRTQRPSTGEERALSAEVNNLARVYALMIFNHQQATPLAMLDGTCRQLIDSWRQQAG
jgi:hypothetical protein